MIIRSSAIVFAMALSLPALAQTHHMPQGHDHMPAASAPELVAQMPARWSQANQSRRSRKVSPPNYRRLAERRGYKKVSSLVNFPSFFPGIGVLYVKPNTLPNGPFLAFDRRDRLISTIYMIPLDEMSDKKKFAMAGEIGKNDHTDLYYNAGHPGVEMPHYHFVIWHVNKEGEKRVEK